VGTTAKVTLTRGVGTYTFRLRVTDDDGAATPRTQSLDVPTSFPCSQSSLPRCAFASPTTATITPAIAAAAAA
jgi:hypothetical protein